MKTQKEISPFLYVGQHALKRTELLRKKKYRTEVTADIYYMAKVNI